MFLNSLFIQGSMRFKNLLLDWSGLVSNDLVKVYEAEMLVFDRLGHPRIPFERFREEFVMPYMLFVSRYFPELRREDQERYFGEAINLVGDPSPYLGMPELLHRLADLDAQMAVLSGVPQQKLVKEAKLYGGEHIMLELRGSAHDKREIVHEVMERHCFKAGETAFLGDLAHDVETGKEAGVGTVAVRWGYYQPLDELLRLNPDKIVESVEELEQFLLGT